MSFEYEKIEAQFAKYLKKVIHNTATNYYKKKYYHQKYELLLENFQDYSADFELNGFFLPTIIIFGHPMVFNDEKIINPIAKLKEREKYFLLEKFLFGKTDKEIARNLNITRQAVTNLKHRAYAKVRNEYNR